VDLLAADRLPRARRAAGTTIAGAVAVLVVLGAGVLVGFDPQVRLDGAVSRALYAGDDRPAALDALLEVATSPGSAWVRGVVYLPVVLWLALRRAWRPLGWVLAAVVLVGPVTSGAKELVGRARPPFEDGGLDYGGHSFPSGHASGVAALVVVGLLLAWPRLTRPARRAAVVAGGALVVLVGLTRLWLGVHFLSDVLAGWALGTACALAAALLLGGLPGGRAALPAREDRP
jgi:membrane-associated phospholipid phosphatase